MTYVYTALGICVLWLIFISFFLFKTRKHYHQLTERTRGKKIDDILDSILKEIDLNHKDNEEIKKALIQIDEEAKTHYQKMGFIRFNPFERVGGEQSFVISLLDKKDDGMVLNFIYTREGVRIYAKQIKSGKGTEYELSDEEKDAIKKAS